MANFSQILSVASLAWGKDCIRFWGRLDQNYGYHGNRKLPLTYNGQNGVPAFCQSPLIRSLSNMQVTRTDIKSRMSSNLGRVRLFTTELFALERSHWLEWGKWCLHLFSVTMNSVFIKLTGNEDRHKISDKFEFPHIWPVIFELHALERWKNDVSSFSQSPLIGLLSNLLLTRTGIKARTSSNFGWIRLLTLELFALEHGNVFP